MAMLAEKRSKTRYLIHSSKTNSKWTEDESNMGRKLLAKMGWKPGQGLGVKEDGRKDPLHVKYKCDNRGLGCTNVSEKDIAVGQQKDFDAFLATLSHGTDEPTDTEMNSSTERSTTSLELRSQKSRARVHYHKFTRGKDLSRASSKDLASILGISDPSVLKAESPQPKPVVPDVGPELQFKLLKSSGSSVDYFAEKLKKRKVSAELPDTSSSKKKKKDDSSENGDSSSGDASGLDSTVQDESSNKNRRKSVTWGDVEVSFVSKYIKDMGDTSTESVTEDTSEVFEGTAATEETFDNVIEIKKKKKKRKEKENDLSLEAPIDSESIQKDERINHGELDNKKKKKKKKKEQENNVVDEASNHSESDELDKSLNCDILDIDLEDNDPNVKKKKKKKSKKGSTSSEEINAFDSKRDTNIICFDTNLIPPTEFDESVACAPLKKKKKKSVNEGVQDKVSSISDHVDSEEVFSADDNLPKKHKKKSKDKCEQVDDDSYSSATSKKNRKSANKEDITVSKNMEEDASLEVFSDKKKKKRKRNEVEENVLEIEVKDKCVNDKAEKKKEKKREEKEEVCDVECVKEEVIPVGDFEEKVSKDKKNKKKVKVEDLVTDEVKVEPKTSELESGSQPTLSALTQERMAKWKDRRKGIKTPAGEQKPTVNNSHLMVQDYHYRKVLATLGYNVKEGVDKNVTVEMPPTNFRGSNLDSLRGYGKDVQA